jgi:hypothetical protein
MITSPELPIQEVSVGVGLRQARAKQEGGDAVASYKGESPPFSSPGSDFE